MSSNAFHPALVGILYGALSEHERAFAQMALAANLAQADVYDDETAERHIAIIDGLKRMIKAAEPSDYESTIEAGEEMRRRHALLGDIFAQLADFKIGSCHINPHSTHCITVNIPFTHSMRELDPRESMREIARRLELQYAERRHGSSRDVLHIEAAGKLQGIDVEIYELITAERPFCDTHHVMVDVDGVCQTCRATEPSFCTEHDSGPIAPSEKCPECIETEHAPGSAAAQ